MRSVPLSLFFFFNDTATTEIYTLSLHDALPISLSRGRGELCSRSFSGWSTGWASRAASPTPGCQDRKSTRLNSSHLGISYAVFCLKKKKTRSLLPELPAARPGQAAHPRACQRVH